MRTVIAGDGDRNDIGDRDIGLGVSEFAGLQVNRIARSRGTATATALP